jgi:hypothetical protein
MRGTEAGLPAVRLRDISRVRPSSIANAIGLPVRAAPRRQIQHWCGVGSVDHFGCSRRCRLRARLGRLIAKHTQRRACRRPTQGRPYLSIGFNGTPDIVNSWRTMLEPVEGHGCSVLFVQLRCEREELTYSAGRPPNPGETRRCRAHARVAGAFDMFSIAPFGRHLCLDITHVAPPDAAAAIVQHYDINAG